MRWAESVKDFRTQESALCGDVLLITAFVSYLGYFTKKYRQDLMDTVWKPYLHQLKVSTHIFFFYRNLRSFKTGHGSVVEHILCLQKLLAHSWGALLKGTCIPCTGRVFYPHTQSMYFLSTSLFCHVRQVVRKK